MFSGVTEEIEYFLDDLKYPLEGCSRLNMAISDIFSEKWKYDSQDLETDESRQVKCATVFDSLFAVQLQNSLEEVSLSLESCRHNMAEGVKELMELEQQNVQAGASTGQVKWASVMSLLAKELHSYHLAASNSLTPIVNSLSKHGSNTLTLDDKEKSGIILAWKSVHEVNRLLRVGYGLSDYELSVILAWMHGEDLSESTRKSLNHQVDSLLQIYKERLWKSSMMELDVPVAFNCDASLIKDVMKDCCSIAEISSAIGQRIPTSKDELESLLHRELPRLPIVISGMSFEIASPGKAFENTKQKMHAVRDIVNEIAQSHNLSASKEQLDLFCMRVLATVCTSVANAASRVAVLMAFGKANLVQVKPVTRSDDKQPHINVSEGTIGIDVPSTWWIVEDSTLFSSLCREQNKDQPITTVEATYQVCIDAKAFLEKRIEPLPVVHVQRLPILLPLMSSSKRDALFQKQFSLRTKLSKATKLFNRRSGIQKSTMKDQTGSGFMAREDASDRTVSTVASEEKEKGNPIKDEDGNNPVPPPRPRRKARKSKRAKSEALRKERAQQRALEEAKKETDWFLSSAKVKSPAVQALKGSKGQKNSASVASFEELQEVIDFLSGSSSSSLCLASTPECDKPVSKDGNSLVSKPAKQENLSEKNETDAKKDPVIQEVNEVGEEKGKTSPVDSGLGSTASFSSSLSSASAVSVLAADPTYQQSSDPVALILENHEIDDDDGDDDKASKETLRDQDEPDSGKEYEAEEKKGQIEEKVANASSTDELKCVGNTEEVKAGEDDLNMDNKERTGTKGPSSPGDLKCVDLEVWKDPGIVEPFDFILESSDADFEDIEEEKAHNFSMEDSSQSNENDRIRTPSPNFSKTKASQNLEGSTESLYYSAWSLNDFGNKKAEDVQKNDTNVTEPSENEQKPVLLANSEVAAGYQQQQLKNEATRPSFDPFNSPYTWDDLIGENMGLLWSEKPNSKVSEELPSRELWSQTRDSPVDTGSLTESTSLGGSRLGQWTANKKTSLTAPLGGSLQSRSTPDVQKTIANGEQKIRFGRAQSPSPSSRTEVQSLLNWPGHYLGRRGSFPHTLYRDVSSSRENTAQSFDRSSPRDYHAMRSDMSPTTPRPISNAYNTIQGSNQQHPMWSSAVDGKLLVRQDLPTGIQSGQIPYRNRLTQTVSMPFGGMRSGSDGDTWTRVNQTKVNTFVPGQGLTDDGIGQGYACPSHSSKDTKPYQLDPSLYNPFHSSAQTREQFPKRFPVQKAPSHREQTSVEGQYMLQGTRIGQQNRSLRPDLRSDPRFSNGFQLWNMPK